LDAAHISALNCDEIAGDRPRQPPYEIFCGKKARTKAYNTIIQHKL